MAQNEAARKPSLAVPLDYKYSSGNKEEPLRPGAKLEQTPFYESPQTVEMQSIRTEAFDTFLTLFVNT